MNEASEQRWTWKNFDFENRGENNLKRCVKNC